MEELWYLEEHSDPHRIEELVEEERAVMADFDRVLPPTVGSPAIPVFSPTDRPTRILHVTTDTAQDANR